MKVDHKFEEFENEVMLHLLEESHEFSSILKEQYKLCSVARREFSGVGFYTYFAVPPDALALDNCSNFHYGNVVARIYGLQDLVGFIVWVKDGYLNCLEAYVYGESEWPESFDRYEIYGDSCEIPVY